MEKTFFISIFYNCFLISFKSIRHNCFIKIIN